ncbi:hypothetical protein STCU_10672 [Strigomonas culicis]|uniref:Uncharacterized protein n=1 Tax=Strigomonas culicis TaxID=28005 RepID=S9TLW5_9TRYP|nr:hypothetical protein STCU_10672 [Strigomonas culicis]|eukprot:EPY17358.1 hypothetical protein STCU_10672 [Strigomonas culicis]
MEGPSPLPLPPAAQWRPSPPRAAQVENPQLYAVEQTDTLRWPLASQRQLRASAHLHALTVQCNALQGELEALGKKLLRTEGALQRQRDEEAALRIAVDHAPLSSTPGVAHHTAVALRVGGAPPPDVDTLVERSACSLLFMLEALHLRLTGGAYFTPSARAAPRLPSSVPSWSRLYVAAQGQLGPAPAAAEVEAEGVVAECRANTTAVGEVNVRFVREALDYLSEACSTQPRPRAAGAGDAVRRRCAPARGAASCGDAGLLSRANFLSHAPLISEVCGRFVRVMHACEAMRCESGRREEADLKALEAEIKKKTHEWTVQQLELRQGTDSATRIYPHLL